MPQDVLDVFRANIASGAAAQAEWQKKVDAYAAKYPAEAKEYKQLISGELPAGWEAALPSYTPEDKGLATRQYSNIMLNALAPALPGLIGGSADLAPSNLTLMKMFGDFQKATPGERNIRFGVREHGMGAICNGEGGGERERGGGGGCVLCVCGGGAVWGRVCARARVVGSGSRRARA